MFGSGPGDKDKMHPQDMRNMMIFFVLAALIYFSYDTFVARPQMEALKKQRLAEAVQIAQKPVVPEAVVLPRAQILGQGTRVLIDNGKIAGSINLQGARLDDVSLSQYFTTIEKKEHVVVLSPKGTEFPRQIAHGWIGEEKVKLPGEDSLWQVQGNNKLSLGNPVTLIWDNGTGLKFQNTYTIDDDFAIAVTQSVTNNTGAPVKLNAYGLVSQTGLPPDFHPMWVVHEGPIGFVGEELHQPSYGALRKERMEQFSGSRGWVGITDKFWLTSLVPPQGEQINYSYRYTGTPPTKRGEKETGRFQADYTADPITIPAGRSASIESHIFTGAKKVLLLEEYEEKLGMPNFDLAVDFGWFWFFSKPFFFILHFLALHSNIAIAMIVMTIAIRMCVFPLTAISYRSFAKMKLISPQVMELRKAYGNNKAALQGALVELYQKEGVNPMSGCLPILVQIPIFFSLYKVLVNTIEMRHAPFFGWIKDMSAPDPTNVFNLFGLIPWDPPSFLHIGVWPCFLLVAMLIQKKLNPPPQDPIQRDMALYFPFLMVYLMSSFASGLVIYWVIGAYLGLMQQIYIMKSLGVPIYLFGEYEDEKELDKAVKEGPSVHPLIQMVEEDVEGALVGDDDTPASNVSAPKRRRKKKK